jgi:Mn2+/Fe2+ NRAMP family transporter
MNKNPGLWMVILVAVILWIIYEMASATEAPSQGVTILHWVLLICAALGLIGAAVQLMQRKRQGGG